MISSTAKVPQPPNATLRREPQKIPSDRISLPSFLPYTIHTSCFLILTQTSPETARTWTRHLCSTSAFATKYPLFNQLLTALFPNNKTTHHHHHHEDCVNFDCLPRRARRFLGLYDAPVVVIDLFFSSHVVVVAFCQVQGFH